MDPLAKNIIARLRDIANEVDDMSDRLFQIDFRHGARRLNTLTENVTMAADYLTVQSTTIPTNSEGDE
jgi:hypothetical protein